MKAKILLFLVVSSIAALMGWRLFALRQARLPVIDRARLVAGVEMRDIRFFSKSLHREMQYRVFAPANRGMHSLPVVYLLHGGGDEGLRSWSNDSDVAQFALRGLLLVMPQGDYSYYTNAALRSQDRYEDYIVNDLAADVARRFPVREDRAGRAIAGVSMGVAAASLGAAWTSQDIFGRYSVPTTVIAAAAMIRSFWRAVPIRPKHRICT